MENVGIMEIKERIEKTLAIAEKIKLISSKLDTTETCAIPDSTKAFTIITIERKKFIKIPSLSRGVSTKLKDLANFLATHDNLEEDKLRWFFGELCKKNPKLIISQQFTLEKGELVRC
jgi:hypothetical protein